MALFSGLTLPDLTGFMNAAKLSVTHREHKAIPNETVAAMDKAAHELKKTDLRLWLVHLCLTHLGARPNDLHEAAMSWLQESSWRQWFFAVVVTQTSRPKASLSYTPLTREVAAEIVRVRMELATKHKEELNDQSPLIPGAHNEDRWNVIYRVHSDWMRQWVPSVDYEGSNYELRRLATQTIRSKYGKDAASDFARHAAKDVTQAHHLERVNVWRDRCPDGDAGISFADARGRHIELQLGEAPAARGWRGLVS
ncbi:MAG: hypothetical protein JWL90_3220 [Chthoniobacteraceae bacterium]|nr:hypothetical protein [Chthoniobacteraceae bacterium]